MHTRCHASSLGLAHTGGLTVLTSGPTPAASDLVTDLLASDDGRLSAGRVGGSRACICALLSDGFLTGSAVGTALRITAVSVEQRHAQGAPVRAPLSPAGGWAVLALAPGGPTLLDHVVGNLTAPNRSRAPNRQERHALLRLVPRLGTWASTRRFARTLGTADVAGVSADPGAVLTGAAPGVRGWEMPDPGPAQMSAVTATSVSSTSPTKWFGSHCRLGLRVPSSCGPWRRPGPLRRASE